MSETTSEDDDSDRGRKSVDMSELVNWLLAGIVVAILGAYAYKFVYPGGAANMVGAEAPSFEVRELGSEEPFELADVQGDVVMLDFWATWCPPCHEQFEHIQKLRDHPGVPENLSIVLVNTDQPGEGRVRKVRRYLERRGLRYPTLLDDGTVRRKYGVSSFPTLVVIGTDGNVTFAEPGVHETEEMVDILRRAVD